MRIILIVITISLFNGAHCITRRKVGESVTFFCQVSTDLDSISWIRPNANKPTGSVALASYDKNSGISRLNIVNLQERDSGIYRCIDSENKVTQFELIVEPIGDHSPPIPLGKPVFTNLVNDSLITSVEGRQVNIVCEAEFNRLAVEMYMTKNGVRLSASTETAQDDSTATSLIYSFVPSEKDHLAEFDCILERLFSSDFTVTTAKLFVMIPPSIVKIVKTPLAVEGDNLTITCISRYSRPEANIKWQLPDNTRIESQDQSDIFLSRSYKYSISSTIVIATNRNVHLSKIACTVHHAALSQPISITKPILVAYGPDSVEVVSAQAQSGMMSILTCITSPAFPGVNIKWLAHTGQKSSVLDVQSPIMKHIVNEEIVFSQTLIINKTFSGLDRIECKTHNNETYSKADATLSTKMAIASRDGSCDSTPSIVGACCVLLMVFVIIMAIIFQGRRDRRVNNPPPLIPKAKSSSLHSKMSYLTPIADIQHQYATIRSSISGNTNTYISMSTSEGYQNLEYKSSREQLYDQLQSDTYILPDQNAADQRDSGYVNESFTQNP